MKPIPESNDKEFWRDADVSIIEKPKPKVMPKHYFIWEGPYAVCVSCPYKHTVPINPSIMDIVNGEIVKKK